MTALHYACSEGHIDLVKLLIDEYKVNVNQSDKLGCLPKSRHGPEKIQNGASKRSPLS